MRLRRLARPLALLILPAAAAAQEPRQSYTLGFEAGFRARSIKVPDNHTRAFEEWVGFRLRGAIVDPRLVSFTLSARPRITQNRFRFRTEPAGSNSRWLELDAGADLLRDRPLRASLRVSRFTFDDRGFGIYTGDISTRNSVATVITQYDNRLMPLRFAFRDESWNLQAPERDSAPGIEAVPVRFRTLELAGGNRKTSFNLQQNDNRDAGFRRLRLAQFQNQQAWGKGSSLQIRASIVSQTGGPASTLSSAALGGLLHLQHLRSVWSDWSVDRLTTRSGALGSTAHLLNGALGWAIRPSLTAQLTGQRSAVDFDAGVERQFRIGPSVGFSIGLPQGFRASAHGAVAYQRYRSTAAAGALVAVVGERHVLDASGSVLLDNPSVVLSTIAVRGTTGELFVQGVDYEVVETGGYARLAALPGGRLRPDVTVLVDYQYAPVPSLDAPALWAEYSGDLDLRWLRFFHRRWLVDPGAKYRSVPRASPVRVMELRSTGAQLNVPAGRLTATAQVEWQFRQDAAFEIRTTTASAGMNARLAGTLRAGVGANYLRATGTTGSSEQVGGQAQVNWLPHPTVQFGTSVTRWRSLENNVARRTRSSTAFELVWQPGLLRAAIYYAFRNWTSVEVPGAPLRSLPTHALLVELTRRF